jgi:hypothetical protein
MSKTTQSNCRQRQKSQTQPDVQNTKSKIPHLHKITTYSKFQTFNSYDRLSTLLTPSFRNQFACTLSNVLLCKEGGREIKL